ncbi:hypothetical protein [Clostridium algidicarnis]|uniref:hypothetical protein n=1 Tax=Clostridium algidicarnis TaxID=37659 RepID=UPI001C0B8DEB|nr:hypothetical protein [Clostridium algidicarnis]MBU3196203.1 hypothetical protein [Clostridium algidicarnis]MBU3209245.1 hypothetical protein [Clostridium algidicarnis]MBU3228894.1 hypothetical protein [Clostridium algidicarnis]MBU3252388.1 hypothetical protein [Clostridium algidicarnis]
MRKIYIIIMSFSLIVILSGCNPIEFKPTSKIISPENKDLMIKGKWYIDDYKIMRQGKIKNHKLNKYLNTYIQIDNNFLYVGGDAYEDVKYKYRRVNTHNYFFNNSEINPKGLGINKDELEVISASLEGKVLYEYIKYDENKLMFFSDGICYFASKRSNLIDKDVRQLYSNNTMGEETQDVDKNKRSGVMIGLRSQRNQSENGDINESCYRTLWISSTDKSDIKIKEKPNIIFPRISGFWELGVRKDLVNGYENETVYVKTYGYKEDKYIRDYFKDANNNIYRNVNFISNDYIALESIKNDKNNTIVSDEYVVLPLDNIQQEKGLKIVDIEGQEAKVVQEKSFKSVIESNKDLKAKLETNLNEESFTVIRKNGHWAFKGRVRPKSNDEMSFLDYDIKILPSKKLIVYDELKVPWNKIKERMPEALDAYTSPNSDIAILISKNSLFVYSIENGELGERPLKKVKLNEEESVIMAEWALDEFVYKWDKVFR